MFRLHKALQIYTETFQTELWIKWEAHFTSILKTQSLTKECNSSKFKLQALPIDKPVYCSNYLNFASFRFSRTYALLVNYDELFCGMVGYDKMLVLLPVTAISRGSHHRKLQDDGDRFETPQKTEFWLYWMGVWSIDKKTNNKRIRQSFQNLNSTERFNKILVYCWQRIFCVKDPTKTLHINVASPK